MSRLINSLVLCLVLGIMVVGCGSDPDPTGLQGPTFSRTSLSAQLSGATFESARLFIYMPDATDQTVNVHRITGAWDEAVVTWNNFGGAFAPDISGSFSTAVAGWRPVNVTALVGGWLNGSYDNFGLLLDQVYSGRFPLTAYNSREAAANQPYLEICYAGESGTVCEQLPALADAYIDEYHPDVNAGFEELLYTGLAGMCHYERRSLITFEPGEEPEPAAIGDYVWHDLNQNGIQEAGEPGVPGVTVNLYDCADNFVATMNTDANGYYLFNNLIPGGYYVVFIEPEGYFFTLQNQGADDAIDSDADPVTGKTACTTLDAGESDLTWDAGLYEEIECGECEGKVTQLTVRYDGSIVDAHIIVKQKKNIVVFDGIVQPGEVFTFYGADKKGTFGPETYYYINGVYNTNIHTSCSQPIGPGLTKGDFTVIEGYSRHGGLLPPL